MHTCVKWAGSQTLPDPCSRLLARLLLSPSTDVGRMTRLDSARRGKPGTGMSAMGRCGCKINDGNIATRRQRSAQYCASGRYRLYPCRRGAGQTVGVRIRLGEVQKEHPQPETAAVQASCKSTSPHTDTQGRRFMVALCRSHVLRGMQGLMQRPRGHCR